MIVDLSGRMLLASLLTAVAAGGIATLILRPTRRLAPRVRPYTVMSRTSLGRSPDVVVPGAVSSALGSGVIQRLFGPILQAVADRLGRVLDAGGEQTTLLKLRQAGLFPHIAEAQRLAEFRVRLLVAGLLGTGAGALIGVVTGRATGTVLLFAFLGFVAGVGRRRGALDSAIEDRQARMRIEIYTVNQLLAMHIRVGGGVVQAVQRLVARGTGDVVEELSEALRLHRNGMPAAEAFDLVSRLTPEPSCARTYSLLAAAEERGSDLGEALLALSEDVREGRREAMKRAATKRRAAMLVPTIAILAPIMLLFVAAPLPTIIFGVR